MVAIARWSKHGHAEVRKMHRVLLYLNLYLFWLCDCLDLGQVVLSRACSILSCTSCCTTLASQENLEDLGIPMPLRPGIFWEFHLIWHESADHDVAFRNLV